MPTSPVSWFGGKARLAKRIIALFPPHQTYVEPFGGSAAVLLAKTPAPVEVYNDLNGDLVNLFRVIRDHDAFPRLKAGLEDTMYSREEFADAATPCAEPVERARRFVVRHRQSYGGLGGQWNFTVKDSVGGRATSVARWRAGLRDIETVRDRFSEVQIDCLDFREIIKRYDRPGTLFYCDPPYIHGTRSGHGGYRHEMDNDAHRDLVTLLLGICGMGALSGYDHPLYAPLADAGWRLAFAHDTPSWTSRTRARRTECLWLSPNT